MMENPNMIFENSKSPTGKKSNLKSTNQQKEKNGTDKRIDP